MMEDRVLFNRITSNCTRLIQVVNNRLDIFDLNMRIEAAFDVKKDGAIVHADMNDNDILCFVQKDQPIVVKLMALKDEKFEILEELKLPLKQNDRVTKIAIVRKFLFVSSINCLFTYKVEDGVRPHDRIPNICSNTKAVPTPFVVGNNLKYLIYFEKLNRLNPPEIVIKYLEKNGLEVRDCQKINSEYFSIVDDVLVTSKDGSTIYLFDLSNDMELITSVYRGKTPAKIRHISFNQDLTLFCVLSDRKTAHIFKLRREKDSGGYFSSALKKNFDSLLDRSFAYHHIIKKSSYSHNYEHCAFNHLNELILIGKDGNVLFVEFDKELGGVCKPIRLVNGGDRNSINDITFLELIIRNVNTTTESNHQVHRGSEYYFMVENHNTISKGFVRKGKFWREGGQEEVVRVKLLLDGRKKPFDRKIKVSLWEKGFFSDTCVGSFHQLIEVKDRSKRLSTRFLEPNKKTSVSFTLQIKENSPTNSPKSLKEFHRV